jgi:hypothetical protein
VFRSRLWARAEAGRIAIRRSREAVVVPAWFATDSGDSAARLGPSGGLVVEVAAGRPAGIAALRLEPGRWALTPHGVGDAVRVSVAPTGSRAWRTQLSRVDFELPAEGDPRVDVVLRAAGGDQPFLLEELRFERTPPGAEGREPRDEHPEDPEAQPVVVDER